MTGLPFRCENDKCPDAFKVIEVPRDEEATCPTCGWFMASV